MKNTYIKLLIGAVLFGTFVALTVLQTPHAERLLDLIYVSLIGLGITHLKGGSADDVGASGVAGVAGSSQGGFALLPMLVVLIIGAVALSGCGSLNAYTGAALNAAEAGYSGAKQNAKSADDMKFILWADTACAIPLGSLARNATGNPYAVNAALTACPIPNVGIVQAKDGQVQVQLTQPTPTAPYVPPAAATSQAGKL